MFRQILVFSCFCVALSCFSKICVANEGPCTQGGFPLPSIFPKGTHLKCTDNGYFEVVQCEGDFCVCVDPTTGYPSSSTKTSSAKIAPTCGNCHVMLSNFVKKESQNAKASSTSEEQWRPICEYKYGNFAPLQCYHSEKCFCVDPVTGKRLGDSFLPAVKLNCAAVQKASKPEPSPAIESPPTIVGKSGEHPTIGEDGSEKSPGPGGVNMEISFPPLASPVCAMPKARGLQCNSKKREVKWYFDTMTQECLAFMFNGFQGNENQFDSPAECWSKCKMPDFGTCAGQAQPAKDKNGVTIICGNRSETSDPCPPKYTCTMMAFHGLCCPKDTQELYHRNYRPPSCPGNGANPVQTESAGVPLVLIGKKCADEFCPAKTTCRQLEIFAHCCPT